MKKERAAKKTRKLAHKEQKKLRPLGRNAAVSKGLWNLEKDATRYVARSIYVFFPTVCDACSTFAQI